jgi:hypothetical protein
MPPLLTRYFTLLSRSDHLGSRRHLVQPRAVADQMAASAVETARLVEFANRLRQSVMRAMSDTMGTITRLLVVCSFGSLLSMGAWSC